MPETQTILLAEATIGEVVIKLEKTNFPYPFDITHAERGSIFYESSHLTWVEAMEAFQEDVSEQVNRVIEDNA